MSPAADQSLAFGDPLLRPESIAALEAEPIGHARTACAERTSMFLTRPGELVHSG